MRHFNFCEKWFGFALNYNYWKMSHTFIISTWVALLSSRTNETKTFRTSILHNPSVFYTHPMPLLRIVKLKFVPKNTQRLRNTKETLKYQNSKRVVPSVPTLSKTIHRLSAKWFLKYLSKGAYWVNALNSLRANRTKNSNDSSAKTNTTRIWDVRGRVRFWDECVDEL